MNWAQSPVSCLKPELMNWAFLLAVRAVMEAKLIARKSWPTNCGKGCACTCYNSWAKMPTVTYQYAMVADVFIGVPTVTIKHKQEVARAAHKGSQRSTDSSSNGNKLQIAATTTCEWQ